MTDRNLTAVGKGIMVLGLATAAVAFAWLAVGRWVPALFELGLANVFVTAGAWLSGGSRVVNRLVVEAQTPMQALGLERSRKKAGNA